jgi:ABC-type nitrate/sulfonate/bicarbonate transport system substrate-binding protein
VARRDAGIATMADLRHHRIGAARGTNADFLLETVLTFAGIPRGDVTIVDLPPEAEAEALAAGKVDAAALSDPHAARAAAALGPQAVEIGTELYEEFSFVATRAETLAARSDVLRALVRSLVCADRAAHARPAEAFAAMRRRFPERTEEELRAALARVTWEVALDNRAVAVLRREAEWLSMTGSGGDAEPDVQRLLHPDLLDAADPEAVNLALRP